MKQIGVYLCACLVGLLCALGWGQEPAGGQAGISASAAASGVGVPRLIRFSGIVRDGDKKPMKGVVGITFALYKDQEGGAPVWLETQNVELDNSGHYTALLGASKSDGLPSEVFASGEARWLGVQVQGQEEQARTLLLSVPYALKALDAETVGGKPASAFMAAPVSGAGYASGTRAGIVNPDLGGTGTAHFIPIWKTSTKLGNSILFQTGGNVGIGSTTPAAKLDVTGGAFIRGVLNLPADGLVVGTNQLVAAGGNVGIGIAGPSAKTEIGVASEGTLALRLDSGPNAFLDVTPTNAGGRFQTEMSTVNNRDLIFLPGTGRVGIGQASPTAKLEVGGPGEGTLTLRLLSGPNVFLDFTPTNTNGRFQTVLNTVNNRDLVLLPGSTSGVGIGTTSPNAKAEIAVANEGTLALRLDSGANSFLDVTPTNAGGRFQTQLSTVNNRDLIFLPGTGRVGIGQTSPTAKLEVGGPGEGSLTLRLLSGPNVFLDFTPTNTGGRFQTVLNTVNSRDLILLSGSGRVGIGTTSPANMFEVAAGGTTLADAWTTRSSRRFKTNIQPLEGALEKIEQLQGVSYQRKGDGKHEIGVIAEDVAQVVPEVVSRDPETKEVQGVDYARLAALLIEAVKSQQAEIEQLRARVEQFTSSPAGQ